MRFFTASLLLLCTTSYPVVVRAIIVNPGNGVFCFDGSRKSQPGLCRQSYSACSMSGYVQRSSEPAGRCAVRFRSAPALRLQPRLDAAAGRHACAAASASAAGPSHSDLGLSRVSGKSAAGAAWLRRAASSSTESNPSSPTSHSYGVFF